MYCNIYSINFNLHVIYHERYLSQTLFNNLIIIILKKNNIKKLK